MIAIPRWNDLGIPRQFELRRTIFPPMGLPIAAHGEKGFDRIAFGLDENLDLIRCLGGIFGIEAHIEVIPVAHDRHLGGMDGWGGLEIGPCADLLEVRELKCLQPKSRFWVSPLHCGFLDIGNVGSVHPCGELIKSGEVSFDEGFRIGVYRLVFGTEKEGAELFLIARLDNKGIEQCRAGCMAIDLGFDLRIAPSLSNRIVEFLHFRRCILVSALDVLGSQLLGIRLGIPHELGNDPFFDGLVVPCIGALRRGHILSPSIEGDLVGRPRILHFLPIRSGRIRNSRKTSRIVVCEHTELAIRLLGS